MDRYCGRPRKSAAERRQQARRAEMRMVGRILAGVSDLRAHRGGQPTVLMEALARALGQGQGQGPERQGQGERGGRGEAPEGERQVEEQARLRGAEEGPQAKRRRRQKENREEEQRESAQREKEQREERQREKERREKEQREEEQREQEQLEEQQREREQREKQQREEEQREKKQREEEQVHDDGEGGRRHRLADERVDEEVLRQLVRDARASGDTNRAIVLTRTHFEEELKEALKASPSERARSREELFEMSFRQDALYDSICEDLDDGQRDPLRKPRQFIEVVVRAQQFFYDRESGACVRVDFSRF